MNTLKHPLNWMTITASGLLSTLLLMTAAQATDSIVNTSGSSTSIVAQHNSNQLIAVRKKQFRKKKIKQRIRVRKTIIQSSSPQTSSPQTEFSQTPPPAPLPPAPPQVPPTPPEVVTPTPPTPTAPIPPVPTPVPETNPPKVETPNPFSLTTKLEGQVIFGATGVVSGDFDRNTAAGYRARLELKTALGEGTLTTRIQSDNLGSATAATPEGSLSWTGDGAGTVAIDALKYEFPLTPQTQLVVAANAGASDDFTDTINPYFDGDGASGSISAFGNRPSIYYTVQGAGAGIRHQLSDRVELSLGYLSSTSNTPTTGNGLFGGSYGALAQLTFKTGENSKVGVTYTRARNSDPGTGSTNANAGGDSNNFGLQGSFQLSPQLALGGWAGYTQNQAAGGDRQIWNWAVTAAAPDFGGKGNLAGLLVGQEPRVTSSGNGTTDTKAGLHIEGFYQFKVSDSISITPGIIYLTAPNQDANSTSAVTGALRTTLTF
jgi:Carbohydrate-selective porin, OprB family